MARPKHREPFQRACECGSSIAITSLNEDEYLYFSDEWVKFHSGVGHEEVSKYEARQIRQTARVSQRNQSSRKAS